MHGITFQAGGEEEFASHEQADVEIAKQGGWCVRLCYGEGPDVFTTHHQCGVCAEST